MPAISFHQLIVSAGTKEGARPLFERLTAQLIRTVHGTVRRLEANPGDWGIDVFVGQLVEGSVHVWQSKFFIDGVGKAQKQQIEDSFESCVGAAGKRGHVLESWCLCIPVSLDPETMKWWERWKRDKESKHGLTIELWDETELEGLLLSPEATVVLERYFGEGVPKRLPRPLETVPADEDFEHMLFVRQLRAAEVPELDAAKTEFFNAELVSREVADKGDTGGVAYLESVRTEAFSLWSRRYNERCMQQPTDPLLPGLHASVMDGLEQHHSLQPPGPVPLSIVHRFGSIHQVVETGKAGWIKDFRLIAEAHTRE